MPASLPAPRKRGRPTSAARWLSLDQVADALRTEPETLARLLERAPGVLPGAILEPEGWQVPERALRVVLGAPAGPLPQFATVEDVAHALRRSPKTVYGWLQLRRPDGSPLLEHRRVLGSILIPAAAVLALPSRMPAAPAFFADREAARRGD
jgi:hypothetical protein